MLDHAPRMEDLPLTDDRNDLIQGIAARERRGTFVLQTELLSAMTNTLVKKGFKWILPTVLAKSTDPLWPDPGAGIEMRPELKIYGQKVRTMQSMILHKMALASLGPEKFFILSPNVRIEKRERASTGKHLYEFTQLEIEIAHGRMRDVFTTFEDVIVAAITAVKGPLQRLIPGREVSVPKTPFIVRPRTELEKEYGSKWEDALSKSIVDPVWVTNIPREFYDYQDETTGEWRNYDLFLPGGYGEVISGAEREHEYAKILRKMDKDGLKKDDYSFLLKLAKDGLLKPMAGAGLGVERFLAYICAAKHVADVQPFPRIPGLVPDL